MKALHDVPGGVGRALVDHHDFNSVAVLRQAGEAAFQLRNAIEGGNDKRKHRVHSLTRYRERMG